MVSIKKYFKNIFASVVVCFGAFSSIMADNHTHSTLHLQLLVNPADPSFLYALNTGTSLLTGPGALFVPRPFGSYFLTNALIFPGGTVNRKKQTDYRVDHKGNPLNEGNSIGYWTCFGKMLHDLDIVNLPAQGTLVESLQEGFYFKHSNNKNSIEAIGRGFAGVSAPGKALLTARMTTVGGSDLNKNIKGTYKLSAYGAPDGQSILVDVKFTDHIKYQSK